MRTFVTVVICGLVALPAGASASRAPRSLVRDASRLSGLPVRKPVQMATVSNARYGTLFARAWNRDYPSSLRRTDTSVYALLGLTRRSMKPPAARAWYDISAQRLVVQRRPAAGRRTVINELVRALIDQNYRLRRIVGLRARDRDRWLAARSIADGTAALASGLRGVPLRGTPLDRFSQLEAAVGLGPGRAFAAELRYLGGRTALTSALRAFPQTTEQVLHVDKFLEREPALPIHLPDQAGDAALSASETFGELDVRNLLQAFGVPSADVTAAGWGGGRLALYDGVAVLVLRWDSPQDAAEWQAAVPRYVAAAFPGAGAHTCPPLDRCWSGPADVAAGVFGTTSVLAAGPGSATVAVALLTLK